MSGAVTPELLSILWPVMGGVLTLLLAGNIFFVRRLVAKLDKVEELVSKIPHIESNLESLNQAAKGIPELRERVAVLESKLERRPTRRK